MKLFPAIDLREGKVVRLYKGDFDAQTTYGDDPLSVAISFVEAGASWIHIVDLDAALTGNPINRPIISKIASTVNASIQTGGGIRDRASADELFSAGVSRVVLGTIAIQNPGFVADLAKDYQNKVIVGLDGSSGIVMSHGWTANADLSVKEAIKRFSPLDIAGFVITDISRDGTLTGPDVKGLSEYLELTDKDVIASGGVGLVEHLIELKNIEVKGKSLAGVIVGKALYEGKFNAFEATKVYEQ